MKNSNLLLAFIILLFVGCSHDGYKSTLNEEEDAVNILFLHHSTGNNIFKGSHENGQSDVNKWFDDYNRTNTVKYNIVEQAFPLSKKFRFLPGYGWKNYPYDYYNIWVKNGDKSTYQYEPTLKTLTPFWDVIVFKHCFPVSAIKEGGTPDIDSERKTIANYKLQYEALKRKMHEYPRTQFIVWTGAALTQKNSNVESANRAREFFSWVVNEWDEENDNIYIWDFYSLQTEGGLFFKNEYAQSPTNSHPNQQFSAKVAPLFCQRIVDVIENNGLTTALTGEKKLENDTTDMVASRCEN